MIRDATAGWRAACRRICSSDAARIVLSVCLVAGVVALAHAFGLTLCPLKRLLGVPCPTCGTTRATAMLLRGDVCGAFAMQPLAVAVLILLCPAVAVGWLTVGGPWMKRLFAVLSRQILFWVALALANLANGIYVIMHGN